MSGFFRCFIYLIFTGLGAFFLGRILPKTWFRFDRFPYRAFAFEQDGKIYNALHISTWKEKLPDMSRIFPTLIPSKRLPKKMSAKQINDMLCEACVAEFIHTLLCISGIACIWLWKGAGGWILYILYVLGNIPFNLIQRYNRPKLARILNRLYARERQTA